jgi:hypothetical protein
MQQTRSKIFSFFFALTFVLIQPAWAQDPIDAFAQADSLFADHQYTAALERYEQILRQEDHYSASMLLKMAYIKEGQRDFTGAMYYLHLYYAKHPSRSVLRKMEELAQTNGLTGYEYNDLKFFSTQFQKHYMRLLQLMMIGAVMIATALVIRRWKGHQPSVQTLSVYGAFLLAILFYINFLSLGKEGIIQNEQVSVMSAPSAGATWLATASQGHKVSIGGEQDIWYKVKWKGEWAYVRKNNLLPLP